METLTRCVSHCHLSRKAHPVPKSDILIDSDGCACLAGFYPLMRASDELTVAPSDSTNWGGKGRWPAPEVLEGSAVGKGADIFSFSMVAIEVCHGRSMFPCLPLCLRVFFVDVAIHWDNPIWRHPVYRGHVGNRTRETPTTTAARRFHWKVVETRPTVLE